MSRLRSKSKKTVSDWETSPGCSVSDPTYEAQAGCGNSVSQSIKFSLERIDNIIDNLTKKYNEYKNTSQGGNSYFQKVIDQFNAIQRRLRETAELELKVEEPLKRWVLNAKIPSSPINFVMNMGKLHTYLAYLKDVANWCQLEAEDRESMDVIKILDSGNPTQAELTKVGQMITQINIKIQNTKNYGAARGQNRFNCKTLDPKEKKRLLKLIKKLNDPELQRRAQVTQSGGGGGKALINDVNKIITDQTKVRGQIAGKMFATSSTLESTGGLLYNNKAEKKRMIAILKSRLVTSPSNPYSSKLALKDKIVCIKTLIAKGKQSTLNFEMDQQNLTAIFSEARRQFNSELLQLIKCIFQNAYNFLMESSPDFQQLIAKAKGSSVGQAFSPESRQRLAAKLQDKYGKATAYRKQLLTKLQNVGITIPAAPSLSANQLSDVILQKINEKRQKLVDIVQSVFNLS